MSEENDKDNFIKRKLKKITQLDSLCKLKAVIDTFKSEQDLLKYIGIHNLKEIDHYKLETARLCRFWGYIGNGKKKVQDKTIRDYFCSIKVVSEKEYVISYSELVNKIKFKAISDAFGSFGQEFLKNCQKQSDFCMELIQEYEKFKRKYNDCINEDAICEYLCSDDERIKYGIKSFIDNFYGESCNKYSTIFYEILMKFGPIQAVKENFDKIMQPGKNELYNWIQFGKTLSGVYKLPVVRPSSSNPFAFKVETENGSFILTRDFENQNSYVLNEKGVDGKDIREVLQNAGFNLTDVYDNIDQIFGL